jgi:hypothetical protein
MKLGLRLFLGLLLLVVLVGGGAILFIDSLVEQAVERGGTHALGVETRLGGASIGLLSGEFALTELTVSNPPGFEQPDFFAFRATRLELPLSTLMEERITVPALVLEGITLDLERNSKGTNYGVILDNLERFESGRAPAPEKGSDGGGGKTFLLRKLVLRDTRAVVNLLPEGGDLTKLSLSIPEIVVEDLGPEMTLAEICALVVKTVVEAADGAVGGVLPEELLKDLRGRMEGLESVARAQIDSELGKLEVELQGEAKKLGPEAEKAVREASEKLDGFLKKKN